MKNYNVQIVTAKSNDNDIISNASLTSLNFNNNLTHIP